MDSSIEALQQQLKNRMAQLDQERTEHMAILNKEQEDRRIIETAEREERVRKIKEAEERVAARRAEIEAAETKRQQEALADKLKAEQLQNEALELVRKQQEKLEWLTKAISDAEFSEEQHKKSLENAKAIAIGPVVVEDDDKVNTHIMTGEAAVGTDGLEVGPELSSHLKNILRRANSNVN